jgi:trehalose utilization protein
VDQPAPRPHPGAALAAFEREKGHGPVLPKLAEGRGVAAGERKMNRRSILKAGLTAAAAGLPRLAWARARSPIRVLCWSEGTAPRAVYPNDICGAVAEALKAAGHVEVRTAGLADPDQGLGDAALAGTDVLFWWGHQRHDQVHDDRVDAVLKRVREQGMGFVALHSSHYSKPFKRLMENSCDLGGVGIDDAPEQITVKAPSHPIARGVSDFALAREEFYDEPFHVPTPDVVVFESSWRTGHHFRSGCVWKRGKGEVFYFRPGHESFRTYFQPEIKTVLVNAAHWLGRPEASRQVSLLNGTG